MKNNTILARIDGMVITSITADTTEDLNKYKPKGCPFEDYTLLNLLNDFIKMYSWKIECKGVMRLSEFIKILQNENCEKAMYYGDVMIDIIERYK